MNIKVEVSVCNFNELIIKESTHQIKKSPEKTSEESLVYTFPRHTNRVVDY